MSSSWSTALRHPLVIGTLLLAIAAGLCAAWWLLPVGLGLWLMMVIMMRNDGSLPGA